MLSAAAATFALSYAHTYPKFLLAALGVGIAGGSFAVGVAYVSRWYPTEKQGTALGIFGAGNVGAAVTKFVAPFVMVAYGWQVVGSDLGRRHRPDGHRLLVRDNGRSGAARAPRSRREARQRLARACAAEEHPGLALFALLLLRLRRLRRAVAVAAALYDQRLRRRHHDRGHDGGDVLAAGECVSRLWRPSVGPLRRAPRDVLDLPGRRGLHLCAVLSADRLRRARHQRPDHLPHRNGPCAVHRRRCSCSASSWPWARRRSSSTSPSTTRSMSARSAASSA